MRELVESTPQSGIPSSSFYGPPGPTSRLFPKRSRTAPDGSQLSVSFADEPQRRLTDEDGGALDEPSSPEPDDLRDPTYVEPQERRPKSVVTVAYIAGKSPKKRAGSSVATSTKARAIAVDPNKGVCLLTNAKYPDAGRQLAHLMPRSTPDIVLTILEWWWQLLYWTLWIDSRYNLVPLTANWHLSLDADDWTFVPHHALITRLFRWSENVKERDPTGYNEGNRTPIQNEYGDQSRFTYYFLPLADQMKQVAIHRYNEQFDPTAVEGHTYPFSTIGTLISHIHPHFVVFSAGVKLAKLATKLGHTNFNTWLRKLAEKASFGHQTAEDVKGANFQSLTDIIEIHNMWTSSEGVPTKPKNGEERHAWMYHAKEPKST